MSFERPTKRLGVFVCDICGDSIEVTEDLDNYKECWGHAKHDGWRFIAGEHYCPDCAGLEC